MKTTRMITLIAALLLGVLANAQTTDNSILKPTDQFKMDQLKIMVMEYGVDFVSLFTMNQNEQVEMEKLSNEKCSKEQEVSQVCANLRKRGAKPLRYFPVKPDAVSTIAKTR